METLFGEMANKVTVKDLIFMKSGIQDFEVGTYDYDLLKPEQSRLKHSPWEALTFVGGLRRDEMCADNCTWFFEPGTHTAYSSTNFVLAGMILMQYADEVNNTWETFDLGKILGLDTTELYKHITFPTYGPLNQVGVTVPGASLGFG
jgi:CubicO group peptidase (beta-lactamase class C family)